MERPELLPDPEELSDLRTVLLGISEHRAADPDVRLYVRLRARDACEYCIKPTLGDVFEVEHIIPPRKWPSYVEGIIDGLDPIPGRRGPHHVENYAWSCPTCNGAKREFVMHTIHSIPTRLFDPRRDRWTDHFRLLADGIRIEPRTRIGLATERRLNLHGGGISGPLALRVALRMAGLYPAYWP